MHHVRVAPGLDPRLHVVHDSLGQHDEAAQERLAMPTLRKRVQHEEHACLRCEATVDVATGLQSTSTGAAPAHDVIVADSLRGKSSGMST